jgi:hypothetical protein
VVLQDESWAFLCSLPDKAHKLNQEITATEVYISHLPAYTSFLISSRIIHANCILMSTSFDLHKTMPLVPKHTRIPTQHCTLTHFPSQLASATCNCIIMLMFQMLIHFQLAAMAPKGSIKGRGEG